MLIVEVDRTYRYTLQVERLWEQSESDWTSMLLSKGLPVKDVVKVLHGGRGRLQVEFYEPVPIASFCSLLEAKTSGGKTPVSNHIYKASKDMVVRVMVPTFSGEPIVLLKGEQIKAVEGITGGQWVLLIITGQFVGTEVLFSPAEWSRASVDLEDLGTSFTMGSVYSSSGENPGEPSENADARDDDHNGLNSPDGLKAPENMTMNRTPKAAPVKKGFPDFPKRKPLSTYSSKTPKKKK